MRCCQSQDGMGRQRIGLHGGQLTPTRIDVQLGEKIRAARDTPAPEYGAWFCGAANSQL